jgi:signal transduction histidine kinase
VAAIATTRALRLFDLQRRREVAELSRARAEAVEQLSIETAERQALQRKLLQQTVWAQETERQHIARELHDEAGQALTALAWGLTDAKETLPERPQEAQERIAGLQQLTGQVMVQLRNLTTRLRPAVLDDLGLVAALISYADDCSDRFPFDVDVKVTGRRRRLPPEIEVTLYRIAQEAITNVARHARASIAAIHLHFGEEDVALSVGDDGIGMDVDTAQDAAASERGWGLAGIRERIELVDGYLDIRSAPGTGTEISAYAPVPLVMEERAYEPDSVAAG